MNEDDKIDTVQISSLEVFTRPSPIKNRINEDAWLILESPGYLDSIVCAVIDGAGVRLPFQALSNKLQKIWPHLSPSAFAANIVKASLLEQLKQEPEHPLREALITANQSLRQEIEGIVGKLDFTNLLSELDDHWINDTRNIRLILPACAITLVRFDLVKGKMDFAHLGDTSLLEIGQNGKTVCHTTDQMGEFDRTAFNKIIEYQRENKFPNFKEAVMSPKGRQFIIESGMHLNYVDRYGKTNKHMGCGVLNGLPEAEDYIEMGTITIDPSQMLGFVLVSDGLELLPPLQENVLQYESRLNLMGKIIQRAGLTGLYKAMSEMTERDTFFDAYPRTKMKDDATGIYLQIAKKVE